MADGLPSGHTSSDFGGSLRFLAPELLDNSAKSAATDVYAFGCLCIEVSLPLSAKWIAFRFLTTRAYAWFGKALLDTEPYNEHSQESRIMRLISDGVPPFTFNGDIKKFMLIPRELLIQCWSLDPTSRPTSSELVSTIRSALLDRYRVAMNLKDILV